MRTPHDENASAPLVRRKARPLEHELADLIDRNVLKLGARAMKRLGRFVILPQFVVTSGRKAQVYSLWDTLRLGTRMLWPGTLKRRDRLHFWYTRHKS